MRVPGAAIAFVFALAPAPALADATLGTVDDFETPHTWQGNSENVPCMFCAFPFDDVCACPPASTQEGASTQLGGPGGAADTYLRLQPLSASGLEAWNRASNRTGDYTAAGITGVILALRNAGSGPLEVRLGLERGATRWVSADAAAIALPGASGWVSGSFSLFESQMVRVAGSDTFDHVMERVEEIRILHAAAPQWTGDGGGPLGLDDVTLPEPGAAAGLGVGAALVLALSRRQRRPQARQAVR